MVFNCTINNSCIFTKGKNLHGHTKQTKQWKANLCLFLLNRKILIIKQLQTHLLSKPSHSLPLQTVHGMIMHKIFSIFDQEHPTVTTTTKRQKKYKNISAQVPIKLVM